MSGKREALAKELGGVGVTWSNQSNKDLQRLVDQMIEKWGHIDVLAKSAERGLKVPLLELSNKDWQQGMDVYFVNVVRPTRLVTPIMQKQNLARSSIFRALLPLSLNQHFPLLRSFVRN